MTDKEINEAIALYLGWKKHEREVECDAGYQWTEKVVTWTSPDGRSWNKPHRYCSDLNDMHEAEKTLGPFHDGSTHLYQDNLLHVVAIREQVEMHEVNLWHATPRQRAEAFLRTIGKWSDA